MTVYKTILKILLKNIGELILALGVTMVMLLIFTFQQKSSASQAAKVAVITTKSSKLTKSLTEYLSHQQKVVNIKDQSQKGIDDALFFQTADYILYLPADFEAQIKSGRKPALKTQVRPGTYSKELVDSNVDQYLNTLRLYQTKLPNLKWDQLLTKTSHTLSKQGKVKLDESYERREKQSGAATIYNLVAYGIFIIIFGAFSTVNLVFNRQEIKVRNQCSPLKPRALSTQINRGLSTYLMATSTLFLFLIFISAGLNPNKVTLLFMLNSLLFILSIVTLSSLITSLFKNVQALNGFENIYGLGSCFLGGVFVSSSLLPSFVNKIACFTPVYWFTKNNNLIGNTVNFNAKFYQAFGQSMLIVVGFTIAFWTLQVLSEQINLTNHWNWTKAAG
ncbi:ABC transporter permease [Lactobacillus xylocopicola]|uniref:ABC-2 type transporter transmembrane domain-containing protein n=1 Tax=Lactobacillus xylocopicola TaxID=2976676 RepID=A0ABN6SJX7_9LACO|nr:ABC transporter permease [Lactobacillus xylocopicola]BDR60660.1 hypothetical protein KIM322_09210 [Lactobacillus xylocopicola]